MQSLMDAAQKLHRHLMHAHWREGVLLGPDPGIRVNARLGRFVKSYSPFLPWADDLAYLQAQGYWILDNWLLADLTGSNRYREIALACSDFILDRQEPEGYWPYPNPEWSGRIATVEGCWAGLGLLASNDRVGHDRYLQGALRWHRFLLSDVGFQRPYGLLAINYFAATRGPVDRLSVPNNSTLLLWFLARLSEVTGDPEYLQPARPVVEWLKRVQLESGELPYAVATRGGADRPHFLCYQYNAFEFIDLLNYQRITGDEAILPVLSRLATYLSGGFTSSGSARYDCFHDLPEVVYYTTALARAVSEAGSRGLAPRELVSDRAFERALSLQCGDGSFAFYSRSNYGLLSDRRSYPRYLAMILDHLLEEYASRALPVASGPHDTSWEEVR